MAKDYDFDELYPGRFLKAIEFQGRDVTYTITDVQMEELEERTGKTRGKGIIAFQETPLALVLNKTNGLCLKAMFGRRTGGWVGKRVTLFPAPIDFEGAEICVRVRGSPDIEKDLPFELKLARKKPRTIVMKRTGVSPAPKANGPPTPWERVVIALTEYGVPKEEWGSLVKSVTGKASSGQVTEADRALLVAHLETAKEPPPGEGAEPKHEDIPL